MIQVTIERDASNGTIQGYKLTGHAEFDVRGKDIVCAGVTTVAVGAVNAVEAVAGVKLAAEIKSGYLRVRVPEVLAADKARDVQLLLQGMLVMLQSIEESYGEYMQIHEILK